MSREGKRGLLGCLFGVGMGEDEIGEELGSREVDLLSHGLHEVESGKGKGEGEGMEERRGP